MDASKLIDWLKLTPRYLFALSLGTGLLLFGPMSILERLGLLKFLAEYRPRLGTVFIAATTIWVSHGLAQVGNVGLAWLKEKNAIRIRRSELKDLSPQERAILRQFIDGNTKTIALDIRSGVHAALESRHVIYRAATVSRHDMYFDYNIQPWAWDYLRRHPEVLEGPTTGDV